MARAALPFSAFAVRVVSLGAMKTARKEQIAWAYVVVTGGRLPTNLDKLLGDMREIMGD